MNLKMKKITREIADQLIQKSKPAKSAIEQSGGNIKVTFNLKNGMTLSVRYNQESLNKSYFLEEK
jgi:hypothetical protein